jgi:Raf kinase inhibitor-like YbhB/YbcL family protein
MTLSMLVLTLVVKSASFGPDQPIPQVNTCDGKDVPPTIEVSDVPTIARSWALVVDDPDAPGGTFVHWVVFNLPQTMRVLQVSKDQQEMPKLVSGAKQGKNDFGRWGWSGPCPPPGRVHHYRFRVWALDGMLGLPPGAAASDVERAVRGHVLAEGTLTGTYRK